MNYWAIICPESDVAGLWRVWQRENVVTISFGSPEYLAEHPELTARNGAYGVARYRVRQMTPGDLIIPFLRDNRIGRLAEFRRESIDTWEPVRGEDHGRRIEVIWRTEDMPPPERVALIPPGLRRAPIRRTVAPLSPDRFQELVTVLQNPDYWQEMPIVLDGDDDEEEEPVDQSRFALEKHLEDFMEANFARINFGRRLELFQDEENTGRQFPTGVGNIDLLAKDVFTGDFVVIELKKTRSDDAVVGQVLRYMGWIREHMAQGDASVSGIVVVPEATNKLRYALTMLPTVSLFTYSVSFALSAIEVQTS